MRVRQLGFVASIVVGGVALMTACGGSNGGASAPVGGQPQDVANVHINDLPGTQPDIDNPDEQSDDGVGTPDLADQDAVDASAPAAGYKWIVAAADDFKLSEDGTASWVPSKVVAGDQGLEVVPTNDGTADSAPLAEVVEFASPNGCVEPYSEEPDVDANDVGLIPCDWTSYFEQPDHFAPMIWLDEDGNITKIADRYHP